MAGGLGYLAEKLYQQELVEEAAKAEALERDPPALVNIASFNRDENMSDVKEVNVSAWINADYNYELIERTNGIVRARRFMYVLFGEGDSQDSKVARGALGLTEAQKEAFATHYARYGVGFSEHGAVLALNGFAGSGNGFSSLVSDAFRDEALTKSENFVYVEPFLDGREAALTPYGEPEKARKTVWMIAAGVAMFGAVKLLFKRQKTDQKHRTVRKHPEDRFAGSPIASKRGREASMPMATQRPQAVMSKNIAKDSPIGRMYSRIAEEANQAEPALTPDRVPENRTRVNRTTEPRKAVWKKNQCS
ncbi:hypothetical protein [uncultured Celeribacter sp.]|uniref:hypothetical protein n=1 Tax=uncultured Celeribacter sp. TaxID=1303376 RepID=UPI002AA89525|nr:hypothetical protein [uncultured Celeribacter sp.]